MQSHEGEENAVLLHYFLQRDRNTKNLVPVKNVSVIATVIMLLLSVCIIGDQLCKLREYYTYYTITIKYLQFNFYTEFSGI